MQNSGRIVFLDYLRAIACMLVVVGHVYLVGPNDPSTLKIWVPTVKTYLFGPDPNGGNPYGRFMNHLTEWLGIGVGSLGVSIFFLISGFVILRALDREPWKNFLVRRAFRIYPSVIAAVLLAACVSAIYCRANGVDSRIGLSSILSSSALLNNFTYDFQAIPVLWSLEVEVFFYVLIAIVTATSGRLSQRGLLFVSAGCVLASLALDTFANSAVGVATSAQSVNHVSILLIDTVMLLIGSMIYRNVSTGWKASSLVYAGASLLIYFGGLRVHMALRPHGGTGTDAINSGFALLVFGLALWSKMEWRWIRRLKWLGDISYPLYLVHVPTGWILLTFLAGRGWGIHAAGAVTMLTVILLAWVLHVAVEGPTQTQGKRIADKLFSRPRSRKISASDAQQFDT